LPSAPDGNQQATT